MDVVGRTVITTRDKVNPTVSPRVSTHEFDAGGLLQRVVRPDGSTLVYEYKDVLGRMTAVTWPSGRQTKWTYAAKRWTTNPEPPLTIQEIPAPGSDEPMYWTCQAVDPLTMGIRRTRGPIASSTDPCGDFATTIALSSDASETISGWMLACRGPGGAGIESVQTADVALEAYLDSWGFVPWPGDGDLPFVEGTGSGAVWPWFDVVESRGRSATTIVDPAGLVTTVDPQRPVTLYSYDPALGGSPASRPAVPQPPRRNLSKSVCSISTPPCARGIRKPPRPGDRRPDAADSQSGRCGRMAYCSHESATNTTFGARSPASTRHSMTGVGSSRRPSATSAAAWFP
ncbi:MAG: RHS repeat protein [Acidobacteria bacterium]|nr:RHS repeat protein [Acidobacteriota bacterium]